MTYLANSENRLLRIVRPEHRLLAQCARTHIDAECKDAIMHLLGKNIDWEYFLNLSSHHHMLPLIYWNLNRICMDAVPRNVFISLWTHFEFVTQRNNTLGLELVRLVKLFESRGISVIPYKGPAAAVSFYGNIALREFGDLDFLVQRKDLSSVCELLEAEGYQTHSQYSPIQQKYHERNAKEYLYWRRKATGHEQQLDTIYLEPHWSITMPRFPFPIDYPGLWRRAHHLDFQGTRILSFSPEDAILIYCILGSKSSWKRLAMISDFAEAIQANKNIDWRRCSESARELGCERMLLIAILLANQLVGSKPSHELLERASSDRNVLMLAQRICDQLFEDYRPSVLHSYLFSPLLFRMRERHRDKFYYLITTLTTPRSIHLRRLPLPETLFPLYRLIVPIHDYLIAPSCSAVSRLWLWVSNRGRMIGSKDSH